MSELAINGGPAAADVLEVPQWPQWTERSHENVVDALESEAWCRLNGDADWVDRFEAEFADYHGAEHAIAVANGTVAIELALRACGVEPGDEVIVPSCTFIGTASAVASCGAVPRLADVDPMTTNVTAETIEEKITPKTVGVVGVHFGGYPMDLDEILSLVGEHDLFFIEDSAHAHGTEWRGEKIGTFGHAGTFSFQETKQLAAGEGGIMLTDDDVIAEAARLIHNVGRRQGEPGYKYYVQSSNYRLPELQGALLSAQLEKLPDETETKMQNEQRLVAALDEIDGIETRPRDDRITQRGFYRFGFMLDHDRFDVSIERFVEALQAEGVPAGRGYGIPLYRQPAFGREQVRPLLPPGTEVPVYRKMHQPGAEAVTERGVSLSHQVLLADSAGIDAIGDAVRKVCENSGEL